MSKEFRFPIPPRPGFPSTSISIIDEASQLVDSYTSSLFEPARNPGKGLYRFPIREEGSNSHFDDVDELIRVSTLKLETLRQSFERAKDEFDKLKMLRRWDRSVICSREYNRGLRSWANLPLEVVYRICAFDCKGRGAKSSISRWGDVYFKSNDVLIKASKVPTREEWIAKATRLVMWTDKTQTSPIPPSVIAGGRWKKLVMDLGDDVRANDLFRFFKLYKGMAPDLEELSIPTRDHGAGNWRMQSSDVGAEAHKCPACTQKAVSASNYFKMPKCQIVQAPLGIIPFFGGSLVHLTHLSIKLPREEFLLPFEDDFGIRFHHVPLGQLKTMRVVGTGSSGPFLKHPSYLFYPPEPVLDTPALKTLIVAVGSNPEPIVDGLLKTLVCPYLDTFILCKIFTDQTDDPVNGWGGDDDDSEGEVDDLEGDRDEQDADDNAPGGGSVSGEEVDSDDVEGFDAGWEEESEVGNSGRNSSSSDVGEFKFEEDPPDFKEMLHTLANKCRGLKRLSIYPDYSEQNFSLETRPLIHDFLATLYKILANSDFDNVLFPNLAYLSIPHDTDISGRGSLVKFLQEWPWCVTPLNALEITSPPYDRHLELDQLELYVHHLYFPRTDRYTYFSGSEFPPLL